jgi:hypothetical protein
MIERNARKDSRIENPKVNSVNSTVRYSSLTHGTSQAIFEFWRPGVPHGTVCVPYGTVTCHTAFAEFPAAQMLTISFLQFIMISCEQRRLLRAIITMSEGQANVVAKFTSGYKYRSNSKRKDHREKLCERSHEISFLNLIPTVNHFHHYS